MSDFRPLLVLCRLFPELEIEVLPPDLCDDLPLLLPVLVVVVPVGEVALGYTLCVGGEGGREG